MSWLSHRGCCMVQVLTGESSGSRRVAAFTNDHGAGFLRSILWMSMVLLWGASGAGSAAPTVVIYGSPAQQSDAPDQQYPLQVLREALAASGQSYQLQPSGQDMVQSRVLKEIAAGHVDVYWSMTSKDREAQLLPIRIPLDKGLNGWRLLLLKSGGQTHLRDMTSLSHLKKLTFLQGHDWPDTAILQHNGLRVLTSAHPSQLYDMLKKQRAEVFPRAVFEAYFDAARDPQALVVDRSLVLVYPSAVYFFVRRDNQALAGAIETGLRRLIANGRFEQLFMQCYGGAIAQARLSHRRQIRLENPLAPPALPPADSPLWYRP